jgi:predicted nucleic acid-binding protein
MRELALDEFIFHGIFNKDRFMKDIELLSEIRRTCCKIVVNSSIQRKYDEKLNELLRRRDEFIHTTLLPNLRNIFFSDKIVERGYPEKLESEDLENHHDAPFIKAALASSDKVLVTTDGRLKELLSIKLPKLRVLTPEEACEELRRQNLQ